MGCFLGCFKGSKDRKRSRKLKKPLPSDQETCVLFCPSSSLKELNSEADVVTEDPLPKLRENQEQQGTEVNFRKKVTFNLNVTTIESIPIHEDSIYFRENDEIEREVKEETKDKEEREEGTDAPKSVAYPPNHRYQNYENSDDEGLDEEGENSDEDEDVDFDEGNDIGLHGNEDESYDSYFSLPLESQRPNFQEVSSSKPSPGSAKETELVVVSKGNVRDRSRYIHSVLNPVENLSHWKTVKARPASLWNLSKENINLDDKTRAFISPDLKSQEPHTPNSSNTNFDDFAKQEILVEASLSNWLVSPDVLRIDPPKSKSFLLNSPISQEERPILGALTMEDIKQSSRTSSPRKSPSRSPEEIPIVGTVGGYWSSKSKPDSTSSWSSGSEKRGIPNTTSKYREDQRVSWHCTPFETRLERALLEMESTATSCSNVESTTT